MGTTGHDTIDTTPFLHQLTSGLLPHRHQLGLRIEGLLASSATVMPLKRTLLSRLPFDYAS